MCRKPSHSPRDTFYEQKSGSLEGRTGGVSADLSPCYTWSDPASKNKGFMSNGHAQHSEAHCCCPRKHMMRQGPH